jgi:hypothetical protein
MGDCHARLRVGHRDLCGLPCGSRVTEQGGLGS